MSKQNTKVQLTERKQAVTYELPIINQGENMLVDARIVHQNLKSKQQFADWIANRISVYGFKENEDFFITLRKSTGGRKSTDYLLTLDMCKEVAMLEKNETGRQIRKYFIAKEKELRGISTLPKEAQLFKGLKAKRINNRVMYPYREVLVRCGYSPNANGNRKTKYWMHFVKDGTVNYVSEEFALHIHHSKQVYNNRKVMLATPPILPLHFYNTNQLNLFTN
jgi:phage anti-repressor protein